MASFEDLIQKEGEGTNLTLFTASGDRFGFTATVPLYQWPVTYAPPSGCTDGITAMSVLYGEFQRDNPQSRVGYHYSPPRWGESVSRLAWIRDSFNNGIIIERNPETAAIQSVQHQYTTAEGETRVVRSLVLTNYTTCVWNGETVQLCHTIIAPDGRTMNFEYDGEARLTAITDMQGYRLAISYGAGGVAGLYHGSGRYTSFAASGAGGISSVADPRGVIALGASDTGGLEERTEFKSPGGRTLTVRSSAGMVSEMEDAEGRQWAQEYDYGVRAPALMSDPMGSARTCGYNVLGQTISMTDALGAEARMTYDANNNLHSVTTPLGNTLDVSFRADYTHLLERTVSPLGATTSFGYDGHGLMESVTNANGNVTRTERNDFGNVIRVIDAAGGIAAYEYDVAGLRCVKMTDARGKTKTLEYDNNDRITKVETAGGVRRMVFSAVGQLAFINELGQEYTATRNEHGKITRITDPLGNSSLLEYNADMQLIAVTDPLGRVSRKKYDSKTGWLKQDIDALNGASLNEYNEAGDLIRWTSKRGFSTDFQYDENHRPLSTARPVGAARAVQYDANGAPIRWSWELPGLYADVVQAEYDADGRVNRRTVNGVEEVAFSYDMVGNLLTSLDATGTATIHYDKLNRCTQIDYPDKRSSSFEYDAVGNRTRMTYPDGTVAAMTYDEANRLPIPGFFRSGKAQELPGLEEPPNRVTALTFYDLTVINRFDAAGRLIQIRRPNDLYTSLSYAADGRCLSLTHEKNESRVALYTAAYTYDAAGNFASEAVTNGGLIEPLPAPLGEARYDAGDRLSAWGITDVHHDEFGNMTDCGTYSATYDAYNRLTRLTRSGITTVYIYNGMGWLVRKVAAWDTANEQTTTYYHDPAGLLLAEEHSVTGWKNYFYANGRLIAFGRNDATLRYIHQDIRGNVVGLSTFDGNANMVARYAYSPYGLYSATGATNGNSLTFAGAFGVRDEGNGFFFMQNRFYDAHLSRFLSTDPMGLAAGPNLYAYAAGNPVRHVDPNGLEWADTQEDPFADPAQVVEEAVASADPIENSYARYQSANAAQVAADSSGNPTTVAVCDANAWEKYVNNDYSRLYKPAMQMVVIHPARSSLLGVFRDIITGEAFGPGNQEANVLAGDLDTLRDEGRTFTKERTQAYRDATGHVPSKTDVFLERIKRNRNKK